MTDQQIESVSEAFGSGEAAKARRWINEIQLSESSLDDWLGRCRKIIRRYKDERGANSALLANDRRRFAVLWSNIEVLKPAVYANKPVALVTRRYNDPDPVGRVASEVLERALNYAIEVYDFDWVMKQVRDDNLLVGVGITWARYVPQIEVTEEGEQISDSAEEQAEELQKDEGGAPEEYVAGEKVVCDHVNYMDWGTNKARTWDEVRFVWRRVFMARANLKARFTKEVPGTGKTLGEIIPLDWKPDTSKSDSAQGQNDELFAKAQIYELWDLETRKVYWVSRSYPDSVLDERDDPLGLKDFFPCPRPVFATLGPDSTIPVPDYIFYQDQAEEIDDLTLRIGILTDSLRMVGFYNGKEDVALQNVFKSGNENKLIPVDGWGQFKEGGGAKGIIEWVPIDMVVACLTACYESRKQLLDDVYQITGISDIMRGDTDPRETKGAQVLKAQWGSSRVRERQKELARFARDNLNIKAEIIAEHFSWQTLKAMTNVDLFTNEEKMMVQQQIALSMAGPGSTSTSAPVNTTVAPSAPPSVPPEVQQKLARPTWEEVSAFLKNDALRRFRIEVETDSTIEPDATQDKADMVEYVSAVGTLITGAVPIVQAAPPMARLIGEIVKTASRKFKFGRQIEETIDSVMDEIAQMPPQPPEEGAKGPDPQIEMAKLEVEKQKIAVEGQRVQNEANKDRMEIGVKMQELQAWLKEMDTNERIAFLTEAMANTREANQQDFEAEQNERDRRNQIDVVKARPKPTVGAK